MSAATSGDRPAKTAPVPGEPSSGSASVGADILEEATRRLAAVAGGPEARLVLAEIVAATLHAFTQTASVRDPLPDTSPRSAEESLAVLAGLDHLRSSLAAVEATWQVIAERRIREDDAQRDVPTAEQGRGAAHEIALARRRAPASGAFSLAAARRLVTKLPGTLELLREGRITEPKAAALASALAHTNAAACAVIDREIVADPDSLHGIGERRLRAELARTVQRLEPDASRDRAERAARARHVTMTPLDDGMARVSAVLRGIDAAGVMKALQRGAESRRAAGARDAVRALEADLLVDAVLRDTSPTSSPAEVDGRSTARRRKGSRRSSRLDVGIIITDTALLGRGDDTECAQLEGYGAIPAHIVTDTLRGSPPGRLRGSEPAHPDAELSAFYRRLYTSPRTGELIAMESRARAFPDGLARMIRWRDVTCRTPWCNAVVRQIDHAEPYRRGGPTSYDNGQGLCVRCNLLKEAGDWVLTRVTDTSGRGAQASDTTARNGTDIAEGTDITDGKEGLGSGPVSGWSWSSPHGAQGISRTPRLVDPRSPLITASPEPTEPTEPAESAESADPGEPDPTSGGSSTCPFLLTQSASSTVVITQAIEPAASAELARQGGDDVPVLLVGQEAAVLVPHGAIDDVESAEHRVDLLKRQGRDVGTVRPGVVDPEHVHRHHSPARKRRHQLGPGLLEGRRPQKSQRVGRVDDLRGRERIHCGDVGVMELHRAGHPFVLHEPGGEGVVGVVGVHGPAASCELQRIGPGTCAEIQHHARLTITAGRCDRLCYEPTGRTARSMDVQGRPVHLLRRIHGNQALRVNDGFQLPVTQDASIFVTGEHLRYATSSRPAIAPSRLRCVHVCRPFAYRSDLSAHLAPRGAGRC